MRFEEFLARGVSQSSAVDGTGRSGLKFSEKALGVMQQWGEGFAVFIGSSLSSFGGDAGAAREEARRLRDDMKLPDVSIKRVRW